MLPINSVDLIMTNQKFQGFLIVLSFVAFVTWVILTLFSISHSGGEWRVHCLAVNFICKSFIAMAVAKRLKIQFVFFSQEPEGLGFIFSGQMRRDAHGCQWRDCDVDGTRCCENHSRSLAVNIRPEFGKYKSNIFELRFWQENKCILLMNTE